MSGLDAATLAALNKDGINKDKAEEYHAAFRVFTRGSEIRVENLRAVLEGSFGELAQPAADAPLPAGRARATGSPKGPSAVYSPGAFQSSRASETFRIASAAPRLSLLPSALCRKLPPRPHAPVALASPRRPLPPLSALVSRCPR